MPNHVITNIPDSVLADLSVDPAFLIREPAEIRAMSADSSVRSKKAEAHDRPLAQAVMVARPTTTAEVSQILAWATRNGIPVTPRGLGSGVVGSGLPTRGGLILDVAGMDNIGEVDVTNRTVTVGAGARLSDVDDAIAHTGLSIGHYPQSFHLASVGGSIAMRGSGTFSSLHGNMDDRVGDLEVVLPTGEVVTTHSMPRASLGPDLKQLFAGSEGMLGIITQVTLKLVPLPASRRFNSVRYDTFEQALETIRLTLAAGVRPAVVRIYDPVEASAKHAQFAEHEGWLTILVFDGDEQLIATQEQVTLRFAADQGGTVLGPEPAMHWEQRRFNWSWFTDAVDHEGGVAEAIEVSAGWAELPALYERMKAAAGTVMPEFMAHVSHVYDQGAALYAIVRGEFSDDEEALKHYDDVWEAVVTSALDAGAVMGHHHGVGLERAPWMERALGVGGLNLLRTVQRALDPAGIMNPGKAGL
ncbi:FAD-binding oxidoreductase [Propionibacteriaceae bacterium Y1923]|uniref:FAD-binding oxidoreductase n=1 Tax=Aestuariimicrobium sp. Y1814 TaxID=3418742 RepID=UPI003C1C0296